MTDKSLYEGGCKCGKVRYQASGEPFSVAHCHCSDCRKHNGAALATFAGFLEDQVNFSGAERGRYESSPGIFRGFCPACGTPLTWEGDGDKLGAIVEFHVGTLDDPESTVPTSHMFANERLSWFDVADDLPRYEGFPEISPLLHHGPKQQVQEAGG